MSLQSVKIPRLDGAVLHAHEVGDTVAVEIRGHERALIGVVGERRSDGRAERAVAEPQRYAHECHGRIQNRDVLEAVAVEVGDRHGRGVSECIDRARIEPSLAGREEAPQLSRLENGEVGAAVTVEVPRRGEGSQGTGGGESRRPQRAVPVSPQHGDAIARGDREVRCSVVAEIRDRRRGRCVRHEEVAAGLESAAPEVVENHGRPRPAVEWRLENGDGVQGAVAVEIPRGEPRGRCADRVQHGSLKSPVAVSDQNRDSAFGARDDVGRTVAGEVDQSDDARVPPGRVWCGCAELPVACSEQDEHAVQVGLRRDDVGQIVSVEVADGDPADRLSRVRDDGRLKGAVTVPEEDRQVEIAVNGDEVLFPIAVDVSGSHEKVELRRDRCGVLKGPVAVASEKVGLATAHDGVRRGIAREIVDDQGLGAAREQTGDRAPEPTVRLAESDARSAVDPRDRDQIRQAVEIHVGHRQNIDLRRKFVSVRGDEPRPAGIAGGGHSRSEESGGKEGETRPDAHGRKVRTRNVAICCLRTALPGQ